jgi:hypothetical protein
MTMLQHGVVPSTGGYNIERSLRFNSADSAYLNRTPGSAGNRKTWTVSFWLKKSIIETRTAVCGNPDASGLNGTYIEFNTSDLNVGDYGTSSWNWFLATYDVFRDPSAWYHFVIAVDTTQATASNRVKIYVNNRQITVFDSTTYPSLNADTFWNNNQAASIGRLGQYDGFYLNGYLTDFYNIGGQQLDPSSFGENDTDTGVWKPKAYTGSYGTNGFKLTFSDNSGTTATTLGKDSSGNGNNWTPNNFSVTAGAGNDSLVDTPTPYGSDTGAGGEVRGNYATFNPLKSNSTTATFSNGNLVASYPSGSAGGVAMATMAVSSGKWYWEVLIGGTDGSTQPKLGVLSPSVLTETSVSTDVSTLGYAYSRNGTKWIVGSNTSYGSAFTTNDVIGFALDMDAGTLTCYLNNISQGTLASGLTGPLAPAMTGYNPGTAITLTANFGQRPFAYTAPSGFKALCTTNLPTPAIGATASTRADDYFDTSLYTGNASALTVTNSGMQPDFLWLKRRDGGGTHHYLIDAVRGTNKLLFSSLTNAELTDSTYLTSFNSNGFTLGVGDTGTNANGGTYVAWNWKANGSGSTNTAGSITSTVSANTTSGFSIVTYTGTGANATVGHGLGAVPKMIIVKGRSNTYGWVVWHRSIYDSNSSNYLVLSSTAAAGADSSYFTTTAPTSSVFSLGTGVASNQSSQTFVAYCFAEVAGYSRFGSYTGNGSADGPMIFTGFRPRWIMVKGSTATTNWTVIDTARDTYNACKLGLYPNLSNAESDPGAFDILSNGFKIRHTFSDSNGNGNTYIYAAFADHPFKYALAR